MNPARSSPVRTGRNQSGVAMVLVMLMMIAMMTVAAVFAYSIKIESRLAYNTQSETQLEWLGRSGVEMARWILFMEKRIPQQAQYDALHQFWAGGSGPLMELMDYPFDGLSLRDIPCGPGRFSLEILDEDRKININTVPQPLLEKMLTLSGAEVSDAQLIAGSIQDWRDRDDKIQVGGGAERDYYLGLDPPYNAKNGFIDDIGELLKVRGITPELFHGGPPPGAPRRRGEPPPLFPPVGLSKVFCANSQGRINVNTASAEVIALILGISDVTRVRETIIKRRAGEDGVDGTPDDMPFRNPQEVVALAGGGGAAGGTPPPPNATQMLSVVSTTFEVRVDAVLGGARRRFVALLRRSNGPEPVVMYFRRD